MFGKSWKHIALSLGILFLIVISGLCYLSFDGRRKSKELVKIYRVTEPAKKDVSNAKTLPSVKNDTPGHPNYQNGVETAQTDPSTKSVSIPSVDLNTPSRESDQQGSDLKTSQQNDERLAKEVERKNAEIQAEIRRVNAEARERKNAFRNVLERANRVIKDVEQGYYKVADKLNALSAEEQQAYFEDFRRGQPAAEEFIRSVFVEKRGLKQQLKAILNKWRYSSVRCNKKY